MNLNPFDLSKPPHPRIISLFVPFLPGLFFELSILWGRTDLANLLAQCTLHLGYYTRMAVVLFCAYFVGLTCLIATSVLLSLMKSFYGRIAFKKISPKPGALYKFLGKRTQSKSWFLRKVLRPIHIRSINKRMEKDSARNTAYGVWGEAAKILLRNRYEIALPQGMNATESWSVWHLLLGTPTPEQLLGNTMVRAMYASGCLGFVAITIAPILHNGYYLGLSAILVLIGFSNDLLITRSWGDPVSNVLNRTFSVLKEIPNVKTETSTEKDDLSL